jgi:hypothetical protein
LEGYIFHRLIVRDDQIELELHGLTFAPPAPPEVEWIVVVCTTARLLNSADEVRAIEASPDWYRKIDAALFLKDDTAYLSMRGGVNLIVACRELRIEHAALVERAVHGGRS